MYDSAGCRVDVMRLLTVRVGFCAGKGEHWRGGAAAKLARSRFIPDL